MISDYTQKIYFNPLFGEADIENSGGMGILKSGINLAIWSAAVGVAAKLAGSAKPYHWALGFFAVAVVGEMFFGFSGASSNGAIIQMGGAPGTAASPGPWAGTPGASVSYANVDGASRFGESGSGYN